MASRPNQNKSWEFPWHSVLLSMQIFLLAGVLETARVEKVWCRFYELVPIKHNPGQPQCLLHWEGWKFGDSQILAPKTAITHTHTHIFKWVAAILLCYIFLNRQWQSYFAPFLHPSFPLWFLLMSLFAAFPGLLYEVSVPRCKFQWQNQQDLFCCPVKSVQPSCLVAWNPNVMLRQAFPGSRYRLRVHLLHPQLEDLWHSIFRIGGFTLFFSYFGISALFIWPHCNMLIEPSDLNYKMLGEAQSAKVPDWLKSLSPCSLSP